MKVFVVSFLLLPMIAWGEEQCSTLSLVRSLFASTESVNHPAHLKLIRVSESKLVDRVIADESSLYHRLHQLVSKYDRKMGAQDLVSSDGAFAINSTLSHEADALVFNIYSVKINNVAFGKAPKGVDKSFFYFIGSLIRGLEKNVSSVPNGFKSVKIIGSQVVNKSLAGTLQEFGFQELYFHAPEKSSWLHDSTKMRTGYVKGTIVKTGTSFAAAHKSPDQAGKYFSVFPLLISSTKKGGNAFKLLGPSNMFDSDVGKTWVLEIPLLPITP